MMAFFGGLKIILANLPEIIAAIKSLSALVEKGIDAIDLRISLKKFDEAVKDAKVSKDTSKLEDLFNPKPPSSH